MILCFHVDFSISLQICTKGKWYETTYSSYILVAVVPLASIKVIGCIFDYVTCCITKNGSISNENSPDNDLTQRQRAMLNGPKLSLTFSIFYGIICGTAVSVVLSLKNSDGELLFNTITSIFYLYVILTPLLTLYLVSRTEKSEERMSRAELRQKKLDREFQMAEEAKEIRSKNQEQSEDEVLETAL